jgi:ATP-dependent RNA helicase DeaD
MNQSAGVENNNKDRKAFSHLSLSSEILNGLRNAGLVEASHLQAKTIPIVKNGRDVVAQVSPGSGKTCVFTIAGLETVRVGNRKPQVLILSPTKEIAKLTCAFANKIGEYLPAIISQCFVNGFPLTEDMIHLLDCQIVTGTPDRIKSLIENHHLEISSIGLFVLNEADRLYAEGFTDCIQWIAQQLPVQRQTLIFYTKQIEEVMCLINTIVKDPVQIYCFDGTKIFYQVIESTVG